MRRAAARGDRPGRPRNHPPRGRANREALEEADEAQFLPGTGGQLGYRQEHVEKLPYFGRAGLMGAGSFMGRDLADPRQSTYDRVPLK